NFTLLGGQTFDLMTFTPGSLTGTFDTTRFGAFTGDGNGVGIGNGLALFVDYDNAGGKIELQVKNTSVTITAPATLHAFTQFPQLILPLSVADTDPGLAPLTMTLTDSVGLLSAHAAGSGTVSGIGTRNLTLTGTLADLNAELASVAYT